MAIQPTNAAKELEQNSDVSPHKLISLLMQGVLERVSEAKARINHGDLREQEELMIKIVKLINALRDSLNSDDGGEIAVNLDRLYSYMLQRIDNTRDDHKLDMLDEVNKLMAEVKSGWDQIEPVEAA